MLSSNPEIKKIACAPDREHSNVARCFLGKLQSEQGYHECEVDHARSMLFFHALGMNCDHSALVAVRLGCRMGGYPTFGAEFMGYRIYLWSGKEGDPIDIYALHGKDRDQMRKDFVMIGEAVRNASAANVEQTLTQALDTQKIYWEYF